MIKVEQNGKILKYLSKLFKREISKQITSKIKKMNIQDESTITVINTLIYFNIF